MTNKKEKQSVGEKAARKPASKKGTSKRSPDVTKVRRELAGMVKSRAKKITTAVLGHAVKGELAPTKYLFEIAGLFPASTDGSLSTANEDCLAKTLLDRLNIPDEPVVADQEDEDNVTRPAKPVRTVEAESRGEESGESGEEKDSVKA